MPTPKRPKPKPNKPAKSKPTKAIPKLAIPKLTAPLPRVPLTPKLPPTVLPPQASSARQRGESLIAQLLELDQKVEADFFEIALVLTELSRPTIYEPLGFTNFKELLQKRELPKREQAYKLIAIARELDAPTARRLGIERAYHAIGYASVMAPTQTVAVVVQRDPLIRIDGNKYNLSTIPTRLLRRFLQDQRSGATPPPPAALHRTARSLSQHLHHAGLESVRVTSHQRGGSSYVTIRLPLTEAQKLASHLRSESR